MNTIEQLDVLVANQRRAICLYISLTSAVFCLGLTLLFFMLLFGHTVAAEPMKTIMSIAGAFVSSVSLLPLKELNACKDRFNIYRSLQVQVSKASESEKQQIDSLVWETLKKVALG